MKFCIRCYALLCIVFCIYVGLICKHIGTKLLWNNNSSIAILKWHKLPRTILLDYNINKQNDSANSISSSLKLKIVILFNIPQYMTFSIRKEKRIGKCEYRNCLFTRDKSKLSNADAILFYVGIRNERMGVDPPINSSLRKPNQVWIFTSVEPPEHYYNTDYRSKSWRNTMNWSILYRFDSDIPNPYGTLMSKVEHRYKDYMAIYKSKTRNALWIVSHCQAASERRQYVSEMVKHGFDVHILGGCGSDGRKISSEELKQIIPTYKFYLGFENALCSDYVTEKYFRNYNFDWIVLVRGGADYHRLLPAKTFISTSDFSNISTLIEFLITLGNDRDRYIDFLRNKDRFYSIHWPANSNCEMCRRLNNLSKFRKTYHDIADYLHTDQCHIPTDF